MATTKDTIAHVLEQLEPLDVRARAMFGEYGLYCDERVVGFICDNTVFLKPSAATERLALGPCYPGSKDYAIVPDAVVDEGAPFRELVAATALVVPPKAARRARK